MKTIVDDLVTIYRYKMVGADVVKTQMTSVEKKALSMQKAMGYSALMAGMGFLFATHKSAQLEHSIIGTATQAEISTKQMWEYYGIILKVGKAYGVSGKQMMEGFEHIVELTGDAVYGMKQLDTMAKMIRGGRMKPDDAGGLLVAYRDLGKGKYDAQQILKMVNEATYIAKKGSISIGNLVNILPRALAMTMNSGETDLMRGNREAVASLEMINRVVRMPKKSVVAYENMIADISKGDKLEAFNALHGTNIQKNEGVLNVMTKMMNVLAKANDKKGMSELMGLKEGDLRVANKLGQLMEVYGRRGSRGAVGVGDNLEYARKIIEDAKASGDVTGEDTKRWSGTATTALARLATEAERLTKKLTESEGLGKAIDMVTFALSAFAAIIQAMPDWMIGFILQAWFLKNVILKLAFTLGKPLIRAIQFAIMDLKILAATNGVATWSFRGLWIGIKAVTRAMLLNPFTFWITALLMLLPLIIQLYGWLKKTFGWGGKKTIDVNSSSDQGGLARLNPANFTAPVGGAPVGKQVNIATNVNIDNVSNEDHVNDIAEAIDRNNRMAYQLA